MTVETYANNYLTQLAGNGGSIGSGTTTINLASGTGAPSGQSRFRIDSEIIIGAVSGTVLTASTRGAEGTTAATHSDGAQVLNVLTAASLLASPGVMTTTGDMEYRGASGQARLPIGSTNTVLTVAGGVPTWAAASTGGILAVQRYAPTGTVTYTNTSSTFVAMDSTNLSATFTAPASGNVVITLSATSDTNNNGAFSAWAIGPHGGSADLSTASAYNNFTGIRRYSVLCYLTGLTPGNSYTYDWFFASYTGSTDPNRTYADNGHSGSSLGPAIMVVQA